MHVAKLRRGGERVVEQDPRHVQHRPRHGHLRDTAAIAYQLNSKTVLRGGTGLSYGTSSGNSPQLSSSMQDFYTFYAPGFGANVLSGGFAGGNPYRAGNPYGNPTLAWPNFDPNKYPTRSVCAGTVNTSCFAPQSPFISIDDDSRPPRIFQYSIGIQREITRTLVVDVSYVGNRGVWFTAPALNIGNYNTLQLTDLRGSVWIRPTPRIWHC